MKILDTRKKEFLEWTMEQDALLEELQRTPKREHYPEEHIEISQSRVGRQFI